MMVNGGITIRLFAPVVRVFLRSPGTSEGAAVGEIASRMALL